MKSRSFHDVRAVRDAIAALCPYEDSGLREAWGLGFRHRAQGQPKPPADQAARSAYEEGWQARTNPEVLERYPHVEVR